MCETPTRRSPLRVTPPKAPVKKNRYVPRTRVFDFSTFDDESFKAFLYCEEEMSPFFSLPPLPMISPFVYKLEFLTGRVLSRMRRAFPFYLNNPRFYHGLLEIINDDLSSNVSRNQRAAMVMELLAGFASNELSKSRQTSIDLVCEHTLFWKLHQTLGLETLKTMTVKIVFPETEKVIESTTVPLFEEDAIK